MHMVYMVTDMQLYIFILFSSPPPDVIKHRNDDHIGVSLVPDILTFILHLYKMHNVSGSSMSDRQTIYTILSCIGHIRLV